MIYKTNKSIFIIHAEEDKEHGHNGVYIESIEEFLEGISIWAVYRFDLSEKLHQRVKRTNIMYPSENPTNRRNRYLQQHLRSHSTNSRFTF